MRKDNYYFKAFTFGLAFVIFLFIGVSVMYTAYNFTDFKEVFINGEVQQCPTFSLQNIFISITTTLIMLSLLWAYMKYGLSL